MSKSITPPWLTPKRRKHLYRIGGALTAVLIVYGVLSAEQAAVWTALAGAILLPAIAQDNVDA